MELLVCLCLQITRREVNSFEISSGKRIPKCELVLEWVQGTPPVRLQHSIGLIGARDHDYFMLHINPGKLLVVATDYVDADIFDPNPVEVGGSTFSSSSGTAVSSHRGLSELHEALL